MPDSHINRGMPPSERSAWEKAIVADYVGGACQREIKKKYRVSAEIVSALLKAAGVETRKGGPRKWVNKRVRVDGCQELRCSKCDKTKPIVEFSPTGLVCKSCNNGRLAAWRDGRRTELNLYAKEWLRAKKRRDPRFRAICAMKCRLVRILGASGKKKSKASVTHFLGTSRNGFVEHIESLMLPGMTWQNRSHGVWHIDHIIPCSAFDHTNPRQVRDCWHYTNLRPLWGRDNLTKYNKILVDCLVGPKIGNGVASEKSLA